MIDILALYLVVFVTLWFAGFVLFKMINLEKQYVASTKNILKNWIAKPCGKLTVRIWRRHKAFLIGIFVGLLIAVCLMSLYRSTL